MTDTGDHQPPSPDDLAVLEAKVARALSVRDYRELTMIGFGEISMAFGWPDDEPQFVCKRMPPFGPQAFVDYRDLTNRYVATVRATGTSVVDTDIVSVPRGEDQIVYLIQPMLEPDSLGEKVLSAADPDATHPLLLAIVDRVAQVTDRLSIDAQVTNWSWDGETATLLDVGTPFMWDAEGNVEFDMGPFLVMLPRPIRGLVRRDLTKLLGRWQEPRGVALDLVANLYREGMVDWVDPAVEACNRGLGLGSNPIDSAEARVLYDDDLKTWPRLKRLQVVERAWQTKIRRRPYDYFIQSAMDDSMR